MKGRYNVFLRAFFLKFGIVVSMTIATNGYGQTINNNWKQDLSGSLQEFVNCENPDPNSVSPCTKFVGNSLNSVYKVNDFYSQELERYLMVHEIASFLEKSGKWTLLGRGYEQKALSEAQTLANTKKAVVAVYLNAENIGHVALILPGELKPSGSWGFNVPNSASFFLNDPQNSYVDKGLSYAFGRDLLRHVLIYTKNY